MLRKAITALRRLHYTHSAEKAIAAYESSRGQPHTERETLEFEAVSWLIASNRKPEVALQRFEEEATYPYGDLDDKTYDGIHSRLQRWARDNSQLRAIA